MTPKEQRQLVLDLMQAAKCMNTPEEGHLLTDAAQLIVALDAQVSLMRTRKPAGPDRWQAQVLGSHLPSPGHLPDLEDCIKTPPGFRAGPWEPVNAVMGAMEAGILWRRPLWPGGEG